jgi:hypothetical protein
MAALLRELPSDGATISKRALRRALGWDDDRFYAACNAAEEAGLLIRGWGPRGAPVIARTITSSP